MVTGNRRRDGFLDKPWAVIAVVAGVLIVVAGVLVFFMGGGGNTAGLSAPPAALSPSSPGQGITVPAGGSSGQPGILNYGVAPTKDFELTDVVVPAQGVFIEVSYRGEYTGMYMSGNVTQDLSNSGERVVKVENPGPSVFTLVKKQDGSSKQVLSVGIWKDGTRIAANSTSLPFGEVTINNNI